MTIDHFLDMEQVSVSKYPKESLVTSVFLKKKEKSLFWKSMSVSIKPPGTIYSVQETLADFFFHTCHNCQQSSILTSQHYRKLLLIEPQDISLSISLM